MKVSANGVLTWDTPKVFPDQEVDIILTIKDQAGQEIFHVFKLQVVTELPPGVEKPGKGPAIKPDDMKDPPVKVPDPELDIKCRQLPADEPLGIKAPTLDQETVSRELPGTANDVVVGGGGRFLLPAHAVGPQGRTF